MLGLRCWNLKQHLSQFWFHVFYCLNCRVVIPETSLCAPSGDPGTSEPPCRLEQVVVFWTFGAISPRAVSLQVFAEGMITVLIAHFHSHLVLLPVQHVFVICEQWHVSPVSLVSFPFAFEHGWSNRCPRLSWLKLVFLLIEWLVEMCVL